VARDSVCGLAVPDRGKSDLRPLPAIGTRGFGRLGHRIGSGPAEIEDVERRATLFRLVDSLPAEQKKVVVLRFVEQKSIKEVAREIRKTEGAVKQLQFRALTSLRARMEGANA
jgi:RNA polymerase sigma factor (sigma-70 family)